MSETVGEIARYIRRRNHGCPLDAEASHSTVEDILCLVDRFEAAHKRECGNMAAMRGAMEEIATDLEDLANRDGMRSPAYSSIFSIFAEKCRKALAAPARNCDVYDAKTAEKEFVRQTGSKSIRTKSVRWLYAPANGGNGDVK